LLPGWRDNPPPVCVPVTRDDFFLMNKTGRTKLITPPQVSNHGNFIVSLGAMCAWMAPQAEELGVDIFPGYAAADIRYRDDGSVAGVIIGDMGVSREGEQKDTYVEGIEIHAQVTVMAEGCRGHLSKQLIKKFELDADSDPQTYGIGLKELWRVPEGRVEPGLVQHGFGWPLDPKTYGGFFIYHLDKDRVAVGYVIGLDYEDPQFSPFEAFQQFKNHPSVKSLLEGGEILSSGARALVEGGYQSLPRVDMPGALLVGDAAGLLNVPKIKGTHQAIRSGMLAAEHLMETQLKSEGFDQRLRASETVSELKKVRNFRPGFQKGLWWGLMNSVWETVTGGHSPWTLGNHADHSATKRNNEVNVKRDWIDRELPPRDRLASVYFATTEHDEDQPIHLKITDPDVCISQCGDEYDHPCTRFCPAGVYEMVNDENGKHLQINSANCVHCKTCDIKDPYQVINWVTPEGGSGPNYQNL
jgi:electron-transferring-flavoprotein dehydrogenase